MLSVSSATFLHMRVCILMQTHYFTFLVSPCVFFFSPNELLISLVTFKVWKILTCYFLSRFFLYMTVFLFRWSGSHIRWGQPFRLRHVTTGKYLSLTEEKSLLLVDKEKADIKSTVFCFRSSKVQSKTLK